MSKAIVSSFRVFLVAGAVLLCALALGCQQQLADATMVGQAAKSVMINVAEIYNTGNVELVGAVISPQYLGHFSPLEEPVIGRKGFTEWVLVNRAAYSDLRVNINEMVAENNMICVKWTVTGTHTGKLFDIEPTGNWVRVEGLTMARLEGGKIIEEWIIWDVLDFYGQLGVEMTPGQI
ncbi:MAG: ester cyclase [Candidatus Zixiibacteriota bacterium]|nr:MAG: ester cyclase [candidate division Zixibacteria bacterium]